MTGTYNSSAAPAYSASVSLPGYDASTFTADQLAFKDECSSIFVRNVLDFCDPRWAYARAYALQRGFPGRLRWLRRKGAPQGICPPPRRWAYALLAAGVVPSRLHMANPDGAVCRKLKTYGADAHEARWAYAPALSWPLSAANGGLFASGQCT